MEFQHELIIPDEGMPFKLFPFEGGSGSYVRERHWHTSVEIFAVMKGELNFFLNEEEIPLHAGELLIINSNAVHSIRAPKPNETAVLQIPLQQFERYYTADRFVRFGNGTPESRRQLTEKIQKLLGVYESRGLGWEYQSLSLYNEILYLLIREFRLTEVGEYELTQSHRLDDLSRITGYMKEHYREELTLSRLAEQFGYSDAYLSRMFRRYAKINFKSYLQDLRTAYAYRDLVNTDHTISQIAMDHGFCSSRSLAEDFRKRFGVLPSELRAKGQKTASK